MRSTHVKAWKLIGAQTQEGDEPLGRHTHTARKADRSSNPEGNEPLGRHTHTARKPIGARIKKKLNCYSKHTNTRSTHTQALGSQWELIGNLNLSTASTHKEHTRKGLFFWKAKWELKKKNSCVVLFLYIAQTQKKKASTNKKKKIGGWKERGEVQDEKKFFFNFSFSFRFFFGLFD
jgi:hypothetical protein